ncbi:TldD/PmbA family protein [Thermococcus waiotapuensis]|uniref:TldD/PmbA family protein n=1 Tax=Thermococcus waiotapuensis TaxID=90909 RepID=A0AAE4NUP2_9EURY|nr:TldD/PmbA family protein [Thermococcus waiotapuensis]MDV3102961.1 TldD/PmbA family protein [Thermococcus waiotapuensis]
MIPDYIEKLVRILEREDVEWEIYWERGRVGSFGIERETLEKAQRKFSSGIGLRIGLKGKMGFSYVSGLSHTSDTLEDLVKRAIKLAEVGNVPFSGFPSPGKVEKVGDIYDPEIEEIPFEEAYELARHFSSIMAEKKAELGGSYTFSGSLSMGFVHYGVLNSNGVELMEKSTGFSISSYVVKKGLKSGSGYYGQSYRSLKGWEERYDILEKALSLAEDNYNAEPGKPYEGEVFLEPSAFLSVLSIFLENLRGDNVYNGRSRFSRPGEEVSSDILSIFDDPTVPGGVGSYSFDGEGSPGQRTPLVEKGILRGFVLDHTFASLMGYSSTGNAVRDFRTVPQIGFSNVVVEPGDYGEEEFEGVIISRVFGEHTANPVSGDFALTVELGYRVEGEEKIPIKGNMFVGNVFEILKKAEAAGKKGERIGPAYVPGLVTHGKVV